MLPCTSDLGQGTGCPELLCFQHVAARQDKDAVLKIVAPHPLRGPRRANFLYLFAFLLAKAAWLLDSACRRYVSEYVSCCFRIGTLILKKWAWMQ